MDQILLLVGIWLFWKLMNFGADHTQENIRTTGNHGGITSYSDSSDRDFRNFCRAKYGHPDPFNMYPDWYPKKDPMEYEHLNENWMEEDSQEQKEYYRSRGLTNL